MPANDSFTCFPKLPIELRLMIWEFSRPGPCLIYFQPHSGKNTYWRGNVPVGLHVNRESRQTFLRSYQLIPQPRYAYMDRSYMNPSIDVLYIASGYLTMPSCISRSSIYAATVGTSFRRLAFSPWPYSHERLLIMADRLCPFIIAGCQEVLVDLGGRIPRLYLKWEEYEETALERPSGNIRVMASASYYHRMKSVILQRWKEVLADGSYQIPNLRPAIFSEDLK